MVNDDWWWLIMIDSGSWWSRMHQLGQLGQSFDAYPSRRSVPGRSWSVLVALHWGGPNLAVVTPWGPSCLHRAFSICKKNLEIHPFERKIGREACNVLIFAIMSVYSFLRFKACFIGRLVGGRSGRSSSIQHLCRGPEGRRAEKRKQMGRRRQEDLALGPNISLGLDGKGLSRIGSSQIQVVYIKIHFPHESRTYGFLNHNCLDKPGLWKGTWLHVA